MLHLEYHRLERRLEGTSTRGPARGKVRQAAMAELGDIEEIVDMTFAARARGWARRAAKQTARRKAWVRALEDARSAMEQDQDRSPEWVVERFTAVLEDLKTKTPKPPSRARAPSATAGAAQRHPDAKVDIQILRRMGYVQKGRVLGAQLGWPRQWLGGSKRRLFFLVDLRQPPGCAMFVLEDRTRTRAQLFWLREVKVLFGRREFRFVCPTDGVLARTLAYSRGQFKPAPGEPPIAAPDNLSTPEPAREVDLSGLPALVQEIVALWTGLPMDCTTADGAALRGLPGALRSETKHIMATEEEWQPRRTH